MTQLSQSLPALGIAFPEITSRAIFRAQGAITSVVRGDVLGLNPGRTDADITALNTGSTAGIFSNVIPPLYGGNGTIILSGFLCIALTACNDNQELSVLWQGVSDWCGIGGLGQITPVTNGQGLYARNLRSELSSTSVATSAGAKIFGFALANQSTVAATRDNLPVLFSGIDGFGISA